MLQVLSALLLVILTALPVTAKEVADVTVPEQVSADDGTPLRLNGAGIRYKVFFKIYIAELYMQHPMASADGVFTDDGRKRMVLHFLYSEVGTDKLVEAWNDGFAANLEPQQAEALKDRIARFNTLFDTVKSGDDIILDYLPGKGTRVLVRGQVKGEIPGKDFNDALLAIWLGKAPVSPELRTELLGTSGK